MKQKSKRFLLFLSVFFCAAFVSAQERQITGTVKDNNGISVANASVLVKGTPNGTSTDVNGNFSIKVNGTSAILEITSVKFQE